MIWRRNRFESVNSRPGIPVVLKNGENAKDKSVGAICITNQRAYIPKIAPRIAPAPGPNRIAPRITGI